MPVVRLGWLAPARQLYRKLPKGKFPSSFLHKKRQEQPSKSHRVYTYDRDIVCLPRSYIQCGGLIQVPRKKNDRKFLVANKLIGKVRLRSDMDEEDVFDEIRSVFKSRLTGFTV